jgi:hypothetical protein
LVVSSLEKNILFFIIAIFLTCIYFYFKTWEKKEAPDSSPKAQRPAWLLTLKQEQKLKWSISIFL